MYQCMIDHSNRSPSTEKDNLSLQIHRWPLPYNINKSLHIVHRKRAWPASRQCCMKMSPFYILHTYLLPQIVAYCTINAQIVSLFKFCNAGACQQSVWHIIKLFAIVELLFLLPQFYCSRQMHPTASAAKCNFLIIFSTPSLFYLNALFMRATLKYTQTPTDNGNGESNKTTTTIGHK